MTTVDTAAVAGIVEIPAALIVAGDNDRTDFDDQALRQLAASIASAGLAQPPTLRPLPDGRYEIVAGERRCRAMALLGWETYPAIVRDLTDDQAATIMLVENLQRRDLDVVEEARAYEARLAKGVTIAELSDLAGIPTRRIQSRLRLLQLSPDVQHLVAHGQITLGQAGQLVGLDVNRQRLALSGLEAGLDAKGYTALIARLQGEQASEPLFDVEDPGSFWSVETYVLEAEQVAAVQQLGLFAQEVTQATRRRDDGIRAMRSTGASLRQIAEAVGMTHAGVAHVLRKTGES